MTSRRSICATVVLAAALLATEGLLTAQTPPPPQGGQVTQLQQPAPTPEVSDNEINHALVRLPLAALLGAALALRPRRRGTPERTPAVVQTQIILAVVGSLIMLVVGASLARAFGIVGAANLIRYRSKIDDPKDAGVMLCALAVGLAAGVGLYALSGIATVFLVACLAIIESFEPLKLKHFELHVKIEKDAPKLRPKIEAALTRMQLKFELRTTADEELTYDVQVPLELETDRITDVVVKAGGNAIHAVEWQEKKKKDA